MEIMLCESRYSAKAVFPDPDGPVIR